MSLIRNVENVIKTGAENDEDPFKNILEILNMRSITSRKHEMEICLRGEPLHGLGGAASPINRNRYLC